MKKYNFLFKPVFFIFNLLLATWLVLEIEKIKPSDFSKRPSFFKQKTSPARTTGGSASCEKYTEQHKSLLKSQHLTLKKLCIDYKYDRIDSTNLDEQLEKILQICSAETPAK